MDLERINRKIIESVKLRFLSHGIIGKQYTPDTKGNILDLSTIQGNQDKRLLYDSEGQFLNDLLKNKKLNITDN